MRDGSTYLGTTEWSNGNVGAGGYVVGLDIVGTDIVGNCDVHNAWIWDAALDKWRPLLTFASMPAGSFPLGEHDYEHDPASLGNPTGVYAIAQAPSNTDIMYMMFYGWVWKTTDRGANWTKLTGIGRLRGESNGQAFAIGGERVMNPKIAIDPQNPDHAWFASHLTDGGTWITTNGGTTATEVTSVVLPRPVDADGTIGPHMIAFDPTSTITGGRHQGLYVGVFGDGVYHTTNGGTSFTKLTGGPTNFRDIRVLNGVLWIPEHGSGGDIWSYNGSWTQHALAGTNSLATIDVNPTDAGHLVAVTIVGAIFQTFNGGTDWTFHGLSVSSTGDIPWLTTATLANGFSCSRACFDSTGALWLATGIGTGKITSFPASGNIPMVWTARGQDHLCVTNLIKPPGYDLLITSLDRSILQVPSDGSYVSHLGPDAGLHNGWGIAYSPFDPSYIVYYCAKNGKWHGYSDDGGTTLNVFPNTTSLSSLQGGSIAVSTPGNIVFMPSSNGVPKYTLDGGTTWTKPQGFGAGMDDVEGGTDGSTGFGFNSAQRHEILCADQVTEDVFYAYNIGASNGAAPITKGVWRSDDGGANWTLRYAASWLFSTYHQKLRAVPGNAGHLFWCGGVDGGEAIWRCTNGLASTQTWTEVGGTYNGVAVTFGRVHTIAFGKAKQGETYPTVGIIGTINDTFGVFVSHDNCATWRLLTQTPNDSIDWCSNLEGDMEHWDTWYVGHSNSGVNKCGYSYTLRAT